MNEELDKTLAELRDNVNHFQKMIENFQQTDKRLGDMESELTTLRQNLEETKGKQVDQQVIDEHFDRLNKEQQAIEGALSRLSEDLQSLIQERRYYGQHREVIETDLTRLEKEQQVTKGILTHLERDQQAMKEALNNLGGNFSQAFTKQRRWIIASSALLCVTVLGVAVLTFQHNNAPAAALVTPGKNSTNLHTEAEKQTTNSILSVHNSPQSTPDSIGQADTAPTPTLPRQTSLMSPETAEKTIKERSRFALTYLKHTNFERLAAKYIHPERGIHFYPMGLNAVGKSFSVKAIESAMHDPAKYDWGAAFAVAPSFEAQFSDYYQRYVYDQDFLANPRVHFNDIAFAGKFGLSFAKMVGRFPGCIFVEYLKNGKSLVLVFERFKGPYVWYLVAVVHNE